MNANPKLEAHPAADLLPNMSDTEYQHLKNDMREHGLRDPIVLHEGRILDGRHRYRACLELAIEPRVREYDGSDPVAYVFSMNYCRRQLHLNASQRALFAAELADSKPGGNRSTPQTSGLTHAKAAEQLNVGERTVDTASALKNGVDDGRVDPKVLTLVREGELSLARAEKVARLPKEKQLEAAAQKGRHKTIGGAPRRKPLARVALDAERQCQQCGDTMEEVARRANDTAAKLAPERCQQLIEVLNRHKERIVMQIKWLEEARDRSSMPSGTESSAA